MPLCSRALLARWRHSEPGCSKQSSIISEFAGEVEHFGPGPLAHLHCEIIAAHAAFAPARNRVVRAKIFKDELRRSSVGGLEAVLRAIGATLGNFARSLYEINLGKRRNNAFRTFVPTWHARVVDVFIGTISICFPIRPRVVMLRRIEALRRPGWVLYGLAIKTLREVRNRDCRSLSTAVLREC